jgi:hypothetical protein
MAQAGFKDVSGLAASLKGVREEVLEMTGEMA